MNILKKSNKHFFCLSRLFDWIKIICTRFNEGKYLSKCKECNFPRVSEILSKLVALESVTWLDGNVSGWTRDSGLNSRPDMNSLLKINHGAFISRKNLHHLKVIGWNFEWFSIDAPDSNFIFQILSVLVWRLGIFISGIGDFAKSGDLYLRGLGMLYWDIYPGDRVFVLNVGIYIPGILIPRERGFSKSGDFI